MFATLSNTEPSPSMGYSDTSTHFVSDEKSITGTHRADTPREFQPFECSNERTIPAPRQSHRYHKSSIYIHHPCPLIHLESEDTGPVSAHSSSDSESEAESVDYQARSAHGRDIVNSWLSSSSYRNDVPFRSPRILTGDITSEMSTSSSQSSPLSNIFKNSSVSDDLISDISSVMGSCILDDKPSKSYDLPRPKASQSSDQRANQGQQRDVPTQAKLQAGLYTSVPLTPASLQKYIDSYEGGPKSKPCRTTPPKAPEQVQPKSGWTRMQESTRKVERETAIRMEREKKNGNDFAKWRAVAKPWM
ncbi:hypothetical protein FRC12_017822 [Ceratobasidium sp. 428]|nr:hypothetical protein FRC09_016732 [Ceratobasidium sp. 395]KAG8735975.1 hypothetical protein FRC12_017822 [Ceratobasidium sp. 428]